MSKLTIVYAVLAVIIIGLYTWSTATGQEYFHPGKEKTTKQEKDSGYRGGHFIFIGHSRGK